jgi:hypothetical protein
LYFPALPCLNLLRSSGFENASTGMPRQKS